MAEKQTPEELRRQRDEIRHGQIAAFPFDRMEVPGDQVLTKWEALRTAGRGTPVVVGDDESLARIAEFMGMGRGTPKEILDAANRLRHPEDFFIWRATEAARVQERLKELLKKKSGPPLPLPEIIQHHRSGSVRTLTREETIAAFLRESEPILGEWPTIAPEMPGLSVSSDIRTGQLLRTVHIVFVPTDDWTSVPAYLRWGGWNSCPHPEYHVAAFRSWRDRFGAQLIGMSSDVLNIRVEKSPTDRTAALELAKEQYAYDSDIVDQGVGSLSALAAALMANRWWYFWWD